MKLIWVALINICPNQHMEGERPCVCTGIGVSRLEAGANKKSGGKGPTPCQMLRFWGGFIGR